MTRSRRYEFSKETKRLAVKRQRNNTSGFKGVTRASHNPNKWQAGITLRGKRQHLGYFDTPEAAHAVYAKAVAELHGAFGRSE